jgi:hypothetical protein
MERASDLLSAIDAHLSVVRETAAERGGAGSGCGTA